jgi:hypothetical protein
MRRWRITITIDPDVAVKLEHLRRSHDASLRDLVNETLRRGLREMSIRPKREPFCTEPIEGVTLLLDNVDNVAEVFAYAEGEAFK